MILTRIKRGAIRTKILIQNKLELKRQNAVRSMGRAVRSLGAISLATHVVLAPTPFHGDIGRALAASSDTEPPSTVQQGAAASLQTVGFSSDGLYVDSETRLSPIVTGDSLATVQQRAEEEARKAAEQKAAEEASRAEQLRIQEAARQQAARQQAEQQARVLQSVPSYSGDGQSIVHQAALNAFGSEEEASCAMYIVGRESGFNNYAQNPRSTAFGYFQLLDTSWAGTGIAKTADPSLQAQAGMNYLRNRYGTPCNAKAFWVSHRWY